MVTEAPRGSGWTRLRNPGTWAGLSIWAAACSPFLDLEIPPGYENEAARSCAVDIDCGGFGDRAVCIDGACFDLTRPCERTEDVGRDITTDTAWSANVCYRLTTAVVVRGGATLTIGPGTQIFGAATGSALVASREGRIDARGTAADPVVFTSVQPAGMRRPGDWGGVVLLGNAPLNDDGGTAFIEGLPEEDIFQYGGTDAEHNCGVLEYVRIEFAGFEFGNDDELNGLTLGGCGSETKIDYVQVHFGSDDGVEVFGGTVGMQHVVISRAQDDSLDWDKGWRGWAQFVVILQDAPRADLDPNIYEGGENGFEADSKGDDTAGYPRSRPRLYNLTMIGSRDAGSRTRAMTLREGTSAKMRNLIVARYAQGLWDIENAPTTTDCYSNFPNGIGACTGTTAFALDRMVVLEMGPDRSTVVLPEEGELDNDNGFDEGALVSTLSGLGRMLVLDDSNLSAIGWLQPRLEVVDESFSLDLRPAPGSVADLQSSPSAQFADDAVQVDENGTRYLGALPPRDPQTSDWMAGWTDFPEN